MTFEIDGQDFTDRLVDFGTEVSADIDGVLGTIAKQKQYALQDYDDYFNAHAPEGYFNLHNYRGREIVEKNDSGVVVFKGTTQNVKETDDQECIVNAVEPLSLFLEWPVDASDRTTHTGFLVDGAVTSGQVIDIDGGVTTIPVGAVVYFNDSKVPSYMVTARTPSSGATTQITIDRPLEVGLLDNAPITVAIPATITGPESLKNALLAVSEATGRNILLDGTFNILAAADEAEGRYIIVNVLEQDNVNLREHVATLCEMCDLILTQKSDGYYTIRRGLEWDRNAISDEITADEICEPVEPDFDDSKLAIGYDLIFKNSEGVAALLQDDVNPSFVRKFGGVKYWQPNKTASSFAAIKYMYASVSSAEYFGSRRLQYYQQPRKILSCSLKPSYNDDPLRPLNLYLGKQVRITARNFVSEPAIVVGYTYSEEKLQYPRAVFQLNSDRITFTSSVAKYRITTTGDFRVTPDGDFRILG